MKKFLCILFTMILFGSLLIIPISAVEESVVVDNYVIPSGEYRFNDTLTDFSSLRETAFTCSFTSNGEVFVGFRFYVSGTYSGLVFRYDLTFGGGAFEYIYKNNTGYISNGSSYRTIVLSSDFITDNYIFYSWFIENTTRLDQPPSDVGSSVISVFSSMSDWFFSSVGSISRMFYDDNGLTLFGYIFILPLAFCVVFVFINLLIDSLLFRR